MRESLAAFLAALLLTSCQSSPSRAGIPSPTGYFSRGYDVTGGGAREAAQVQQMLRTIAAKTNLPERSPSSSDYSPVPIALYGDSRVRLLATRHKDYVHVEVIREDYSGASSFAQVDQFVRSTLSRRYQKRFYVEPEADFSHPIITY